MSNKMKWIFISVSGLVFILLTAAVALKFSMENKLNPDQRITNTIVSPREKIKESPIGTILQYKTGTYTGVTVTKTAKGYIYDNGNNGIIFIPEDEF